MAFPLTGSALTATGVSLKTVISSPVTITPTRTASAPPPWAATRSAVVRLIYPPLPIGVTFSRAWGGQMTTGPIYIVTTPPAPTTGQIWPRSAAQGAPGAAGPAGPRGSQWFVGHGAPGTIAGSAPGDFYLDIDTGNVYAL